MSGIGAIQGISGGAAVTAPVVIIHADGSETGYADPWLARAAAVSGDTVHIGPGNYVKSSGVVNLLKTGVNWYFEAGANVLGSSATDGGLWDDSGFSDVNAAATTRVYGYGKFRRSGCPSARDTYNVCLFVKSGSDIVIECDEIHDENAPGVDGTKAIGNSGVRHAGGGSVIVRAKKGIYSDYGTAIWWDNGESFVEAPVISGQSAMYAAPSAAGFTSGAGYFVDNTWSAGEFFVRASTMIATGANTAAGAGPCIVAEGTLSARVWVTTDTIVPCPQANGIANSLSLYGTRFYLNAKKILHNPTTTMTENVLINGAEVWADIQKLTVARIGFSCVTGKCWITCQNIEDPDNRGDWAIKVAGGGPYYFNGQEITGGTGGGTAPSGCIGIFLSGGAAVIEGYTITTLSNANPVAVSASGLTLKDVVLVAPGVISSISGAGTVALQGSITMNNHVATSTLTNPSTVGTTIFSTTAAGTTYSLTNTSAAVDFGTTDPVITITKAGMYEVEFRVRIDFTGATFAASRTVTIKARRTNNTAADLTLGSFQFSTGIITTLSATFIDQVFQLPDLYSTSNIDDAITIFADVSTVPSAGSIDVSVAWIKAKLVNPA